MRMLVVLVALLTQGCTILSGNLSHYKVEVHGFGPGNTAAMMRTAEVPTVLCSEGVEAGDREANVTTYSKEWWDKTRRLNPVHIDVRARERVECGYAPGDLLQGKRWY